MTGKAARKNYITHAGDAKFSCAADANRGAMENLPGSAERYSQPRAPNAERSTPGAAYHPVEP